MSEPARRGTARSSHRPRSGYFAVAIGIPLLLFGAGAALAHAAPAPLPSGVGEPVDGPLLDAAIASAPAPRDVGRTLTEVVVPPPVVVGPPVPIPYPNVAGTGPVFG